jgi:hypothetical protein
VKIARTIAALAVLGCAFGLGWAGERLLCRGESSYEIRRAYLLLEEERFSEEELRRVFAPYAESELNGELYVVATSDPRLHDELVNPRWYLESVHTAFSSTPLLTDGPLAYFYRVGENAFFHYRRMRGESRWVVIRGEDVFNRRFGETRLRFVGQDFFQLATDRRCVEHRRMIVFSSTEANEDDLPEIARYYAGLTRMSGQFDFSIWSSLEGAATYRTVRFPSLEAMEWFERTEPSEVPGPLFVGYFFRRLTDAEGEYMHYNGKGPPRWTRRIALDGPKEP